MTCQELHKFFDAYLDGEFAGPELGELEAHLLSCEVCRAHAESERELYHTLRQAMQKVPSDVPETLRKRIDAALIQETRRFYARRGLWVLGGAVALAACAAFVIRFPAGDGSEVPLVESVVRNHQRAFPVEVASPDPDNVGHWFSGKVDVPVRPPRLKKAQVTLLGGRLSHVRDRDAAELIYDVRGRRVSVLVFDPQGLRIEAPRRQTVRNREVLLGGVRGYNVALFRERGVGYAVASDGGDEEVLDFVNAAFEP